MDGVLDFSIGLTEGVAWPWPIAVYLSSQASRGLVGRNSHDDEASGAFGRRTAPQSIRVDRAGNDSPRHALPGA